MPELGRILFFVGLAIALAGFLIWKLGDRFSLGRLPGDLAVEKPGFSL